MSNIITYIIDNFSPGGKPRKIVLDLEKMSAEELAPYIDMDPRIRRAYAEKKIEQAKNTLNNSTDTIEKA